MRTRVRQTRYQEGEHRLPGSLAILAALAVYALMPDTLLYTPRWLVPALELALLVALVIANPVRVTRRTSWSREASIALSLLVIASNLASLVLLIQAIASPGTTGENLLRGGIQIWVSNVIGFALLYWEIDRGGPAARAKAQPGVVVDWSFPQDQDPDERGWAPVFLDYLYVSMTNSTAFSPTDTMPMTTRAKLLMGVQGMAALLVSLLVVARAVNTLTG